MARRYSAKHWKRVFFLMGVAGKVGKK